jgi:hypothetical protein
MRTQIIQVPYDSGYKDYRMGRGPRHIVRRLKAEKNFPVDALAGVYCEPSSRSPSSVAKSFLAEQFCKFSSSTLCITLY